MFTLVLCAVTHPLTQTHTPHHTTPHHTKPHQIFPALATFVSPRPSLPFSAGGHAGRKALRRRYQRLHRRVHNTAGREWRVPTPGSAAAVELRRKQASGKTFASDSQGRAGKVFTWKRNKVVSLRAWRLSCRRPDRSRLYLQALIILFLPITRHFSSRSSSTARTQWLSPSLAPTTSCTLFWTR